MILAYNESTSIILITRGWKWTFKNLNYLNPCPLKCIIWIYVFVFVSNMMNTKWMSPNPFLFSYIIVSYILNLFIKAFISSTVCHDSWEKTENIWTHQDIVGILLRRLPKLKHCFIVFNLGTTLQVDCWDFPFIFSTFKVYLWVLRCRCFFFQGPLAELLGGLSSTP